MYKILLSPYEKKFYEEFKLVPTRHEHSIVSCHILYGKLNVPKLDLALKRMVSNYILLNSHVDVDNEGNLNWAPNNEYHNLELYNNLTHEDILLHVKKPFHLNSGPLYRFVLNREEKNLSKFIIIMHHIIIGDNSVEFFCSEISNFYNDENYKSFLSAKIQIRDLKKFSKKYTDYLNSTTDFSKTFWKKLLGGVENIDLDFLKITRNKIYDDSKLTSLNNIKEIKFKFNKNTLNKLYKIKNIYKVSPYIFSQIIFALLIYRHTSQLKFCISYPMSIKETNQLVFGANININVITYDFTNSTNIIDVIKNTKILIKSFKDDSISHDLLPIIEIIGVSNSKLLDIVFSQNNLNEFTLNFTGLKSESILDYCIDLSNDIIFKQGIVGDKLCFRVKYFENIVNTKLLNHFINRYKRIFIEVLNELLKINNSDDLRNINSYNLLSNKEHNKIIYEWNKTNVNYQFSLSISEIFQENCNKTPDALALIYKNKKYTYKNLNTESNLLANFLKREYAIKPDSLVMLFLEKNENLIISILAILKSGAAYVPIDPDYPDERISYIIEDTKSRIILTNDKNKLRLDSILNSRTRKEVANNVNIIAIDNPKFILKISNESINNPIIKHKLSNLAYVIYTSGTTGTPKGVMVEHKGLINFNNDLVKRYKIGKGNIIEVIALFSNYVFDASVEQILLPLLNGHTLLILPNLIWLDENKFFEYLNKNRVTHIHSTPRFLEQFDFKKVPTLRRLIFGGEALTKENFLKIKCNKECNIISEYGLAETSVTSSVCFVKNEEQTLIIGKPISNTKFYILDKNFQPLPINTIGELFIGGVGLSRGYLNRKKLTNEKFIQNPFQNSLENNKYENRVYRTGDLCRFLEDGNIEFIGRNDFQVKISGYRIELHEIENVLSTFNGIKQSIVLTKNTEFGKDKYLVGYYISCTQLREDLIFEYLFNKLPSYMIPKSLVHLEKFPLTINGKVDINFLRSINTSENYQTPVDTTSIKLAKIWSTVLKKDKIGIYDNFFFLGGNSLFAMKATILAQEQNLNLEFHELYQSKNLISLSKLLESKKFKKVKTDNIRTKDLQIPISLFQQEKWELYIKDPKSFTVPLILTLKGRINKQALEYSFNVLFKEHDILRTSFIVDKNNKGFQSVSNYKKFKLPFTQLVPQENSEKKLKKEIANFIEKKLSLEDNSALRFTLIEKNTDYHLLILVLNHFSFDSISLDILFKGLCERYNEYPNIRSKKNIINQYAEFSTKQREGLDEEIHYLNRNEFKNVFSPINSIVPFSSTSKKYDITKANKFIQKDVLIPLDKVLSYTSSKFPTITPFALSIYFCFLFNVTKLNSLSVSYLMTVRPSYREINTIGCFTHTYPVSVSLSSKDKSFKNILNQVNKKLIKIRKVQNIPFSYLAYKLGFSVATHQSNLIYISQNMNDEPFNLKNIEAGHIEYTSKTMREDLAFELFENNKSLKLRFTFKNGIYTKLIEELLDNIPNFINQILYDETINILSLSVQKNTLDTQ